MLAPSQVSFSPQRMATFPRSNVSVTTPENSKLPPGFVFPPLQASSHSRSFPGERGSVFGGGWKLAILDSGISRGCAPLKRQRSLPRSPMNSRPSLSASRSPVVPGELHRKHVAACGESEMDDRGHGIGLVVAIGGAGFDAHRRLELQHAEDGIETIRTHITERAAAEVRPASPREWQIDLIVGTFRSRAEPLVPIQAVGNGLRVLGALQPLRPEGPAGPIDHFANGANGASPNPFAK